MHSWSTVRSGFLIAGTKINVTETARRVVDLAIRVSGGSSYFRGSMLERVYREVLAGLFHPSDDASAHNTVANAWLGSLEALTVRWPRPPGR